jgi:hypothetical protein
MKGRAAPRRAAPAPQPNELSLVSFLSAAAGPSLTLLLFLLLLSALLSGERSLLPAVPAPALRSKDGRHEAPAPPPPPPPPVLESLFAGVGGLREPLPRADMVRTPPPPPSAAPAPTPASVLRPRPSPNVSSAPISGVLLYTEAYGQETNYRFALAELAALALILRRNLVIPAYLNSKKMYDFAASSAALGLSFLESAPPECAGAPHYRIAGPFGGEQPLTLVAAPAGFAALARGPVEDLTALVGDQGGAWVDDLGVAHGPSNATLQSSAHKWWPYKLYMSDSFAEKNRGNFPFPNLVPLLQQRAGAAPCLVLDLPFLRLDCRRYPAACRRGWGALQLLPGYAVEAQRFSAALPLNGSAYIALHLRAAYCGGVCSDARSRVGAAMARVLAAPACAGARSLFIFTDTKGTDVEGDMRTLFEHVVVGGPIDSDPYEYRGLFTTVLEQEIGARALCFLGHPDSTFSAATRLRRQTSYNMSEDSEFVY